MDTSILERVIEKAGGQTALATKLGIRKQSITKWKHRGLVPLHRVPDVARLTGFSPHDIRPDFFDSPTNAA